MKKIIITSMALASLAGGIFLYSCKKQETILPQNSITTNELSISIKEDRLVFQSIEDYENTIDHLAKIGDGNFAKWENEIGFNSMRKNFTETELNKTGIVDPLLATLLNKDAIIQIENEVYKIDVPNESVKVINVSLYSGLNSFGSKSARTYSTQDNILEMIKGNITRAICNGCPGGSNDKYGSTASSVNISMKVVYQRAGIYYSLQSKIKKDNCLNGCPSVGIYLSGSASYQKCGGGSGTPSNAVGGTEREYNWRAYEGSNRLKQYNFNVNFSINDTNDGTWQYFTSLISC
jgi:hypothetical protein